MAHPNQDETARLLSDIESKEGTSEYSTTRIRTDERVIARITDGIYRQPASAIRELLANAFDADATEVVIDTDAPRFSKITVRDNGSGLGKAALAHILHHIGGSSKRTREGVSLNVVSKRDPTRSPAGRRLIGKIGIGLFSVAQLTPHFQIISKVKGEQFRRVADVLLTTYTEEELAKKATDDAEFEAGTVTVWSIPAEDIDSHGTDIVLMDLKRQAQRLLRTQDRWAALRDMKSDGSELRSLRPPVFHIGEVDLESGSIIDRTAHLPWEEDDEAHAKFRKLVDAVIRQSSDRSTPGLADVLDNYLHMLWQLGLALPFDYVGGHPLEKETTSVLKAFKLSNHAGGQATELVTELGQSVANAAGLESAQTGNRLPFVVKIDGIQIYRPIDLDCMPNTSHALKDRLLFVGKCRPDLSRVPDRFRGGPLHFEAYFYWAPKIAPREHNGVLVRINDASGTLFDETFMKYQVAEQTRLRQITGEIFILEGLDAALNIDRESFNYSHPHYLILQRWVHAALRQVTNQQKRFESVARHAALQDRGRVAQSTIQHVIQQEWLRAIGDEARLPPVVTFFRGEPPSADSDSILVDAADVFDEIDRGRTKTGRGLLELDQLRQKVSGIAQILEAYGLLQGMDVRTQSAVLRAIARILDSGEA